MLYFSREVDLGDVCFGSGLKWLDSLIGQLFFTYNYEITYYHKGHDSGFMYPPEPAEVDFEPMFGVTYEATRAFNDVIERVTEGKSFLVKSYYMIRLLLLKKRFVTSFVLNEERWASSWPANEIALDAAAEASLPEFD